MIFGAYTVMLDGMYVAYWMTRRDGYMSWSVVTGRESAMAVDSGDTSLQKSKVHSRFQSLLIIILFHTRFSK